jgi:hypothetical protein
MSGALCFVMASWLKSYVVPREFFQERAELHFWPHLGILVLCLALPPLALFAWLTIASGLTLLSFLALTATPVIVLFSLIIATVMILTTHILLKALGGGSTPYESFAVFSHAYVAIAAGVAVVAALMMVQQPFVPALANANWLVFGINIFLMLLFIGDFFFVAVEGLAVRHDVSRTKALIALLVGMLVPLIIVAALKLYGVNFAF